MKRWMKRVGLAMAAGCVAVAMNGILWGQAGSAAGSVPVVSRRYEVSTVKPSDPDGQNQILNFANDKLHAQGETVENLIKFAYGLNMGGEQQIQGAQKWVSERKWDIEAKEDTDTIAAFSKMTPDQRRPELQALLQTLLEQRFHLKAHRETRELPVYALMVAKNGAKLTPAKPQATGPDGKPTGWSGAMGHGKGDIEFRNAPPSLLASGLGFQPEIGGRTVIDKTGLTGKYDFELKWTPDMTMANDESSGASLFTALQEELGLRLEPAKAPVEVVVIDQVEEPTGN